MRSSDHTKVKQRVRKTEQCRKKYMKTSAKHHMDLKSLGLANRVPGKMYDDMARMLEGLSLEKQVFFQKASVTTFDWSK